MCALDFRETGSQAPRVVMSANAAPHSHGGCAPTDRVPCGADSGDVRVGHLFIQGGPIRPKLAKVDALGQWGARVSEARIAQTHVQNCGGRETIGITQGDWLATVGLRAPVRADTVLKGILGKIEHGPISKPSEKSLFVTDVEVDPLVALVEVASRAHRGRVVVIVGERVATAGGRRPVRFENVGRGVNSIGRDYVGLSVIAELLASVNAGGRTRGIVVFAARG